MLNRHHCSFRIVYSFPNITTSILCYYSPFPWKRWFRDGQTELPFDTKHHEYPRLFFVIDSLPHTQRNHKDNRNSCSWTLKSSTKSRVQKRGMFKAKNKDRNITCFSVKTSVSENRNQSTNYCLHDQYYTGHSVYTLHGLLSPTSSFNIT